MPQTNIQIWIDRLKNLFNFSMKILNFVSDMKKMYFELAWDYFNEIISEQPTVEFKNNSNESQQLTALYQDWRGGV